MKGKILTIDHRNYNTIGRVYEKLVFTVLINTILISSDFDSGDGAPIRQGVHIEWYRTVAQKSGRQYLCGQIRDMACEIFSLTR